MTYWNHQQQPSEYTFATNTHSLITPPATSTALLPPHSDSEERDSVDLLTEQQQGQQKPRLTGIPLAQSGFQPTSTSIDSNNYPVLQSRFGPRTFVHPGLISSNASPYIPSPILQNLLVPGVNLQAPLPTGNFATRNNLTTISIPSSSSSSFSSLTNHLTPHHPAGTRFAELLRQKQANEALARQGQQVTDQQIVAWEERHLADATLVAAESATMETVLNPSFTNYGGARKESDGEEARGNERNSSSGERNAQASPVLGNNDDRQRSTSSNHMAPIATSSSPRLQGSPIQSTSAQGIAQPAITYRPHSQQSAYFQRLMATKLAGASAQDSQPEPGVEALGSAYWSGNNGTATTDSRETSTGAAPFNASGFTNPNYGQEQSQGNGSSGEEGKSVDAPAPSISAPPENRVQQYPPYYNNTQASPSTAIDTKQSPHPSYPAWSTPPSTAGLPHSASPVTGVPNWSQPWDNRQHPGAQPAYPTYPAYPYGAHGVKPEYNSHGSHNHAGHHYNGMPGYPYPGAPAGYGYADRPLGFDGHHPYAGAYTHYPVEGDHAHNLGPGFANGEGSANGGNGNGSASGSGGGTGGRNGDVPKKAVLACHFCRMRKLKCDGEKDSCANCTRRGLACTYDLTVRRRGPGKKKKGQDEKGDMSGTTDDAESSRRRSKDASQSAPNSLPKRTHDDYLAGSIGNGVPPPAPYYPLHNGYPGGYYQQPPPPPQTHSGGFNMDHGAYDPGQYMHPHPSDEGSRSFEEDHKPSFPPMTTHQPHPRTDIRSRPTSSHGAGNGIANGNGYADDGPSSKRLRTDENGGA